MPACKSKTCKTASSTEKPTKITKAAPARRGVLSVEFRIVAPEAKEVFLVGDFNGWDDKGLQMRKGKDGTCKKKVPLKPGRYEYLFVVDGDWQTDPTNDQRCANPFGSENSVIEIVG